MLTVEEVNRMNSDILAGPDNVHPVILKALRYEIACLVTVEWNSLLMSDWYQRNRRWQMQYQFLIWLQRTAGQLQTKEFHFHIGEKSKTQTTEKQTDRILRHISGKNQQGFCKRKHCFWYLLQLWKNRWTCSKSDLNYKKNSEVSWDRKGISPCNWLKDRKKVAVKLHNKRRSRRDCIV